MAIPCFQRLSTKRLLPPDQSTCRKGNWFDDRTGNEYPGEGWSDIPAPIDTWPCRFAATAFSPVARSCNMPTKRPTDPLTFTCYMATDGLASYTLDQRTTAPRKPIATELSPKLPSVVVSQPISSPSKSKNNLTTTTHNASGTKWWYESAHEF